MLQRSSFAQFRYLPGMSKPSSLKCLCSTENVFGIHIVVYFLDFIAPTFRLNLFIIRQEHPLL